MKFGLAFASSIGIEGADALEICRRAESVGFESVWGGEHVILPTTIRRAVRIADGYFPGEGNAERLGLLIGDLRRTAEVHGRDPASIEINAMFGAQMADPVAGAEQLSEIGVGRVMIPAFFFAGPGRLDRLSEFGERVIPLAGG